jgi:hypothetical protein
MRPNGLIVTPTPSISREVVMLKWPRDPPWSSRPSSYLKLSQKLTQSVPRDLSHFRWGGSWHSFWSHLGHWFTWIQGGVYVLTKFLLISQRFFEGIQYCPRYFKGQGVRVLEIAPQLVWEHATAQPVWQIRSQISPNNMGAIQAQPKYLSDRRTACAPTITTKMTDHNRPRTQWFSLRRV